MLLKGVTIYFFCSHQLAHCEERLTLVEQNLSSTQDQLSARVSEVRFLPLCRDVHLLSFPLSVCSMNFTLSRYIDIGRQAGRQAERQADGQTERQRYVGR